MYRNFKEYIWFLASMIGSLTLHGSYYLLNSLHYLGRLRSIVLIISIFMGGDYWVMGWLEVTGLYSY